MADLLAIAQRVLGWANENEEVEVVAVHDRDTEIRVYQGEIEQFTASESQGVGIRVIADNRQGFAYAGTLDDDVLAETVQWVREASAPLMLLIPAPKPACPPLPPSPLLPIGGV